jgi:hypothetical protein
LKVSLNPPPTKVTVPSPQALSPSPTFVGRKEGRRERMGRRKGKGWGVTDDDIDRQGGGAKEDGDEDIKQEASD